MRRLVLAAFLVHGPAFAQDVTVETFVRAETDRMIRSNMAALGMEFGKLSHVRDATTPDRQAVIRMNQDTLYSSAVVDLTEPVEFTLPEIDGRYMSMHVINQDHYMLVESRPGTYTLTQDKVGTRFAFVAFRTFADVTNPEDIAKARLAQDGIEMRGGGPGPFEAPDWNLQDLDVIRGAMNDIAILGFDASNAFGGPGQTHPIDHLVGTAAGWGGLPAEDAIYLLDSVEANDGETPHAVTVSDVPVDAFWSVTVYNADGFMEANDLNVNSYNDFTADRNDDGTITLNFGGCEDGRPNCIPITPGWNYAIRLYEPQEALLNGEWTFPQFKPVD